jgi:hypothetical protein
MEGGSPGSYEKVQMDEHEDKGESPVNTERMKSNNSMEMLKFFDLLPEGAREEILKNLRRNATEFTKDKDEEEELPVDTKLTVEDYKSAMEGISDGEKASLYDEYIEAQRKKAHTKKYEGKIPSHQLESGLQITLASHSDRDLGNVKFVLRKQDRGDDPISRKKTRDKVVDVVSVYQFVRKHYCYIIPYFCKCDEAI